MSDVAVSVVIPTYNRAGLILRAVSSVLVAMASGDELIVVDDGSTDRTAAVLRPLRGRLRYVRGQHRGVGAARNFGIAHASRPLVAFLDSDDEWSPDKLVLQRAFMQARADVLFCFSDLGVRRIDGRPESRHGLLGWHHDPRPWNQILGPGQPYSSIAPLPQGREDFNVHVGDLYLTLLRVNYVPTQSAMVWRERAGDALHFGEDINIHEDHECFARLARIGPAAYFDCETFWQWGHDQPRLSQVNDAYWATCRLKMLERTFGADEKFLRQHGERYRQMLRAEHLRLARSFLREGRPAEARRELRLAGGGSLAYRALARLPGGILRQAVAMKHALGGTGVS